MKWKKTAYTRKVQGSRRKAQGNGDYQENTQKNLSLAFRLPLGIHEAAA
jgi:hypothetical protein